MLDRTDHSPSPASELQQHRCRTAAARGLDFLLGEQERGYPEAAHILTFPRPTARGVAFETHSTTLFQRLIILDTLLDASADGWDVPLEVIAAEVDHLVGTAHPTVRGGWSYLPALPNFPPDADDLGAALRVAARVNDERLEALCRDAVDVALESVNTDGSVNTWLIDRCDDSAAMQDVKRCVQVIGGLGAHVEVVANLATGLSVFAGRQDEFCDARLGQLYGYLVAAQNPDGSWPSKWYWGKLYSTYRAVEALREVKAREAAKGIHCVKSLQNTDGSWHRARGTALDTAFGLLTLAMSADPGEDREAIAMGQSCLLQLQRRDGSWPSCPFVKMETRGGTLSYGSRSVTTAFAVQALRAAVAVYE